MENILWGGSPGPSEGLTTGVIFIATSLYGLFFILFALSSLILHSQILTNKKKSSGPFGTSVYLTLGYTLFFTVSLVRVEALGIQCADFAFPTELDCPLDSIHAPEPWLRGW